jgi:hypothetical protein
MPGLNFSIYSTTRAQELSNFDQSETESLEDVCLDSVVFSNNLKASMGILFVILLIANHYFYIACGSETRIRSGAL